MVFPSVPVYLDPPDWNQYQQTQHPGSSNGRGSGGGGGAGELQQAPQGSAQPRPEGGMQGLVRPASMADRARLAKLPQPEQALKCPRCDSTNTKFCYFNNYSLSQPRHFCKTCRRYWTRGGALRNIPVGGGCRRNKRSKSGSGASTKSQATAASDQHQSGGQSSSSTATSLVGGVSLPMLLAAPQMSFMGLQPLADYSGTNIGLNFAGIQPMDAGDYQAGVSSSVGLEQWRIQQIQQFPFFGGLEAAPAPAPVHGMYGSFDGDQGGGVDNGVTFLGQLQSRPATGSTGLIRQMASVKMEDSSQGLNLRRHLLGLPRNDQYWNSGSNAGIGSNGGGSGGGGWMTDLSGFNNSSSGFNNSSSSGNLL